AGRACLASSSDPEVRQLVGLVEAVLTLPVALLPAPAVPDLDPGEDPRHDHVAVEAGVLAQVLRDRDAALLVRGDLGRARRERPCGVELPPTPLRRLSYLLGHLAELLRRIDGEATASPLGHVGAARQLVAVLRGQNHPPLGVQGVLVLPEEHLAPSPAGCRPMDGGPLPRPPLRAPLRPPSPQVNPRAPTPPPPTGSSSGERVGRRMGGRAAGQSGPPGRDPGRRPEPSERSERGEQ